MFRIFKIFSIKMLSICAALVLLSGCANTSRTDFPVAAEDQTEITQKNVNIVLLTPENISSHSRPKILRHSSARLSRSTPHWQYFIGVGDVLSITVWDHPELTLPGGPERSQIESGSTVNANGEIFYPYITQIKVIGRTVGDIQKELTTRLAEFIPDPQIEVKVAAFNAQKVVVTGAVNRPGSQTVSNIPLTLIEAVNAAGGLNSEADSTHITVQRNGKTHYIHLQAFLSNGRSDGNPILLGGDIVNIPEYKNNVAYVMGEVAKPGTVDLGHDGVNLTEALTKLGGLKLANANAQGIFVFRTNNANNGFDVFQLDATTPLAFVLATKFALHPQDVVYVVTDPAAQWNAIIATLLPSITAIRGVQVIGEDL